MPIEEITEVLENLQLQPFSQVTNTLVSQIVPGSAENPLTWTKLSTLNFVSMQCVIETMSNVRKMVVAKLDGDVLLAISSAIEEIRIPPRELFNNARRFPEGLYVAWSPAHPMIQSICLLQKLCVVNLPTQPLTCARLLAVVENVENCVFSLNIKDVGVYDREKFERTIAEWKFNWRDLGYQYDMIEDGTRRKH